MPETEPEIEPETTKKEPKERVPYSQPNLIKWGTLLELTAGGGGKKLEPSKRRSRF